MDILDHLARVWHYFVAFFTLFISVIASAHAVLYKRDSRATVLWVGLIWLVPLVGAVLYLMLGVNRVRRRATLLRARLQRYQSQPAVPPCKVEALEEHLGEAGEHLGDLARVVQGVVSKPLVPGNAVEPLVNGDVAFPLMLEAIEQAKQSISLCTYIFDNGKAGERFIRALSAAVKRGVEVRVLIDDSGARYSWPTVVPRLKAEGVPVARFMPTFAPFRLMAINLRNHRKISVVDGWTAFTGGMNIRDGNYVKEDPYRPVQDVHFRVRGPIVAQLQEVFADDWLFTTREALRGERWFPPLECAGPVIARSIADGPDEDMDRLYYTLLGALAAAKTSVCVVTPYFLPNRTLITALNLAALRGVKVDIVMPELNNLPFVKWASFASLRQMVERGCRVWLALPPFDHTKLMLVDGHWALIGSANWDTRSLRLNFEFNVECYDRDLVEKLEAVVKRKLAGAHRVTQAELEARPLPVKLRDGVARLFNPYL
ncbi:MAG: cardiolipin synthase [Verrucomicrobiota bacterium]